MAWRTLSNFFPFLILKDAPFKYESVIKIFFISENQGKIYFGVPVMLVIFQVGSELDSFYVPSKFKTIYLCTILDNALSKNTL